VTKFTRTFLYSLLLLLTGTALINVVVDPFVAFRAPRLDGINVHQPAAMRHMRITKPYQIQRQDFDVLITGSSRGGRGFDCQFFISRGQSCFNSSLNNASLYESYRFIQQKPKSDTHFIVSLEFWPSLKTQLAHPQFKENRLFRSADGDANYLFFKQAIEDSFGLLLSQATTLKSRDTFRFQGSELKNPRADGKPFFDNHGHWGYAPSTLDSVNDSDRVNRQLARFKYIRGFMGLYFLGRLQEPDPVRHTMKKHLHVLAQLLRFAHDNKLKLSLSLSPGHAEHWTSVVDSGVHEDFNWWMNRVVSINHSVAAEYDQEPYPLYNFGGVNQYSSIPAPSENRPDSLNPYFTDTMHFSTQLGDKILEIITAGCGKAPDSGFGQCLDMNNVATAISRMNSALDTYMLSEDRVLVNSK
jgi:hypothetical protein